MATTTRTPAPATAVALRSMAIMRDGTPADFAAFLHPAAYNFEQVDEPPAARGVGPERFHAVALWLRAAYAKLDFEVHEVIAQDDLVVARNTMTGRHTGPFVAYDRDGRVSEAFPPTGRRFAMAQTHWFRLVDGLVAEHWANRDELGAARELGWVPPRPGFLLRAARLKRQAQRAADPPVPAEVRPHPLLDRAAVHDPRVALALRTLDAMPPALAGAFADLGRTLHTAVADRDVVAVHCTLTGRHSGTFVARDPDGRPTDAFPPTGRRFAVTESHWLRIADGTVVEHSTDRDDLGMALQLGWAPPAPAYLARMALAKRRARRS